MTDFEEIDEIYAIESELLNKGYSVEELVGGFTYLLLMLVESGKIRNSAKSDLGALRQCLQELSVQAAGNSKEKFREDHIAKVWTIHDVYRETDNVVSALARCVIYCFIDQGSWALDNQGEETPIFIMYFDLKRLDLKSAAVFKQYFSSLP